MNRHYPHRPDVEYPAPNVLAGRSPAPPIIVECWCLQVERLDRRALDRFTREIWKNFDGRDLEPLKWAILRRRRLLARQAWP